MFFLLLLLSISDSFFFLIFLNRNPYDMWQTIKKKKKMHKVIIVHGFMNYYYYFFRSSIVWLLILLESHCQIFNKKIWSAVCVNMSECALISFHFKILREKKNVGDFIHFHRWMNWTSQPTHNKNVKLKLNWKMASMTKLTFAIVFFLFFNLGTNLGCG